MPPYAGNFSAWGLLGADLTQSAARTRIMKLGDEHDRRGERDRRRALRGAGRTGGGPRRRRRDPRGARLDMRYVGQEHTLTIPLRSEDGRVVADARRDPRRVHARVRARRSATRWTRRSRSSRCGPRCERRCRDGPPSTWRRSGRRRAASLRPRILVRARRVARLPHRPAVDSSSREPSSSGPAILLEETATTYLDAGFTATRARVRRALHPRPGGGRDGSR